MPQDYKSSEPMDNLVQEIRENLQLGSAVGSTTVTSADQHRDLQLKNHSRSTTNFKIKTVRRANQKRSCPYGAPPSSRACDTNCKSSPNSQLRKWNHQRRRYPSTCIPPSGTSAGSDNVDDPLQMLQELITDGSLIKEAVKRLQEGLFRSSSAKTFYESEDDEGDCTPPNDLEDL